MTISNGYSSLAACRAELNITSVSDTGDDSRIEQCVEAASRMIDRRTGRKFWQDSTVQTREFYADDYYELRSQADQVLDISTTTGLIVKLDEGDTGAFGTTLTISTHFLLQPANSGDESPAEPYTAIRLVDGAYRFPMSTSGRPGVQVTAKFGWATVPTDVAKACLIQAVQLFKSGDAVFGGLSFGDGSFLRVRAGLHPVTEALVAPYAFPRIA